MVRLLLEERVVDSQGRVSLPAEWRKKYLKNSDKVVFTRDGKKLIILPLEAEPLSKFYDSVPVDIKSDLGDWKKVKKELLTGDAL